MIAMLSCWLFAFYIDLVASFVVHAKCALMPAVSRGVMTVLSSLASWAVLQEIL